MQIIYVGGGLLTSHMLPQVWSLENHVSGLKKKWKGDTCHGNIQKQFFFGDLEERIFDIEIRRPLRRGRYLVAITERYK